MPRNIIDVIDRIMRVIPEDRTKCRSRLDNLKLAALYKVLKLIPEEWGNAERNLRTVKAFESLRKLSLYTPVELQVGEQPWEELHKICAVNLPDPTTCDWAMKVSKVVRGVGEISEDAAVPEDRCICSHPSAVHSGSGCMVKLDDSRYCACKFPVLTNPDDFDAPLRDSLRGTK